MKKFFAFTIIAVLAIGGAAYFYPTFKDNINYAGIEPAAGSSLSDAELRDVLAESLKRANEALEKANAELAESNTFAQDDISSNTNE